MASILQNFFAMVRLSLAMDQLFLLPDRVLGMDSLSFREDVAAVAPDFLILNKNYPPHNSLDSTDSNRSSVHRVLEDVEGLVFARASKGCLWLCKIFSKPPVKADQLKESTKAKKVSETVII